MDEYKYTDINHPPVPMLKVGDICYTHWTHGGKKYDHVSKCEVRKVEVKWFEPTKYGKQNLEEHGYWYINYYIRVDIDSYGLKSTKMYPYHTGEEGGRQDLFITPQEVMDANIRDFKDMVMRNVENMRKTMFGLGYTKEMTEKLLEYRVDEK